MSLWNQNSRSKMTGFVQSTLACHGEIFGVVLNDETSLKTLGGELIQPPYAAEPKAPVMYIKPRNTIAGSGSEISLPAGESCVEIGAVLGVVIGRAASRLDRKKASECIAGYVAVADLSLPHSSYYRPAIRERCFDGACPMGELAPVDTVNAIADIEIATFINNRLVATRKLSDLHRSVPRLLSDVCEFITFKPGDILLTGVTYQAQQAKIGDTVRVEVAQVGNVEFTLKPSSLGASI